MAPRLCASCSSRAPGWYRSPCSWCVPGGLGQSDWQEVGSPGGEGIWGQHCPEPHCLLHSQVFLHWLLLSACEFGSAPHRAPPALELTSLGWSLSCDWARAVVCRTGGPSCMVRLPALSCSLSCLTWGGWKEGRKRERSKNERGYGSCAPCSAGWKSFALPAQQVGHVGTLPASNGFSRLGCCLRHAAVWLSLGSLHLSLLDS